MLLVTLFATSAAFAEDRAGAESPVAAKHSMLSEFFDPELQFAEGCGCYVRRAGATETDGLLFFGKLGDRKESGWIALDGELTELPKEKPRAIRTENAERVWTYYYRSSDVAVQVELTLLQANEGEEVATYAGEITVSSGGRTETVQVAGTCGC